MSSFRRRDELRRADARTEAVKAARLVHQKLGRVIALFEAGLSDVDIGKQLELHETTVYRYRQVLHLQTRGAGGKGIGRYFEQHWHVRGGGS